MAEMPKQFKIAELLANGERPYKRLDAETRKSLAAKINDPRNSGLTVNIVLSARCRLLDGHNRLEILQEAGRKTISLQDVRIDRRATDPESEALAAIGYQRDRRQTGMSENAEVALDLMQRFGWSRSMVAEKMGVSRMAVTKWFQSRPDLEVPTEVIGKDGRAYDTSNLVSDEEVSEPPKPKRAHTRDKPGQRVIKDTDKYAAEITNPGLRTWIVDHADAEDYESLIVKWEEITKAAQRIADELKAAAEAAAHEGTEESF